MKKMAQSPAAVKLLCVVVSIVLALLIFVLGTNAYVDRIAARRGGPMATRNDRFLVWLLGNDPVFVPARQKGIRETSQGLRWLDNGYDSFSEVKSSGTFRIFCVGGSTTRGWPFHTVVSYPKLLNLYLRDVLPGRKIEVINAGFMAFDLERDAGVVKEIAAYRPDLVLLYEGRNELHYRPFRKSYFSWVLGAHAWLLRHVRIYGWRRLAGTDVFDQMDATRTFLETYTPEDTDALHRDFMRGLAAIAGQCARQGCRVALLVQVIGPGEEPTTVSVHTYNAWLREFARSRNVALIDVDSAFRGSGIPLEDLILPGTAVHPDLNGYALMARTVCRALAADALIAPPAEWRWRSLKDDGRYFEELGATAPFLGETYGKLADLFTRAGARGDGDRYRKIAADYAAGKRHF